MSEKHKKGTYGESLANIFLGMMTSQGILFSTVCIGGTWPTFDIYGEIESSNNQTMCCFFQVKATESGYTQKDKKLKVKVEKSSLDRLTNFNAPTYLIGVDFKENNPPISPVYITTIRGTHSKGISSMTTKFPITQANLILLKQEIEAYWTSLNPLVNKSTYITNF